MTTKSTAEHTPGPWKVSGNVIIANPPTGYGGAPSGAVEICKVHDYPNAALIAAAPETAAERDRLRESNAELVAACQAAIAYDRALFKRGQDMEVVESLTRGAIAQGDDLVALYDDWIDKAHAALARHVKAEGRG